MLNAHVSPAEKINTEQINGICWFSYCFQISLRIDESEGGGRERERAREGEGGVEYLEDNRSDYARC